MEIGGSTILSIIASIIPALIAFVVLLSVARTPSSRQWAVPGLLAAAAIAPLFGTFFAVRMIFAAFRGLSTTSSGGFASMSAGMWEAAQPLIAGLYFACAATIVTSIVAIRSDANQDEEESAPAFSNVSLRAMAIILLAFVAVGSTSTLFRGLNVMIIDVIDPNAPHSGGGIAEAASMISSRLLLVAALSAGFAIVLLIAAGMSAAARPSQSPSSTFALALAFAAILGVLAMTADIIAFHSWTGRLRETAMTGRFPR